MRVPSVCLLLLGWLCLQAGSACGAAPAPDAAERLIKEVGERSETMSNLEELCDGIGARLTGSQQLRLAQGWAMKKLQAYGAVNVHQEAYELGRPWKRGVARARLLNANRQSLVIAQKGWTAGSGGPVQGDIALLDVRTLDAFRAAAPGLRGKIVLVVSGPQPGAAERKDGARFNDEVNRIARKARFAAVLLISGKEDGALNMWGGPHSRFDTTAAIITKEGASLLKRLLARGVVPRVEVELGGGFGKAPVQAHNVVADFIGSDLPDEMVIVGAHLDSWDLATGATDNGAGSVVAMEVMRAMLAQGLRPKRTLRIVLFSGEEQEHAGSKAYVAAHRDEWAKIQAVFVQDTGAGRILGFPDMQVDAWNAGLTVALAPAQRLGTLGFPYAVVLGSDHDAFLERGIPAFTPLQDTLNYRTHTQHSERDSVDHVPKADLIQAAQVMTVAAWGMLNGERLPHQKPAAR